MSKCFLKNNMIIGKGAGVILIDDNERILFQHRDKSNRWNQDAWSEFGGQIEKGETPEKAIRRELKEELGIKLINLKFFKKYKLQKEKGLGPYGHTPTPGPFKGGKKDKDKEKKK